MNLDYRYRVKSLNGLLNQQSRAVNDVWNFCNDTQKHARKWTKAVLPSPVRRAGRETARRGRKVSRDCE
ncbi:hypothetical protein [Burkholderia pyrrocinia]|uniref:hypothetical protein n=1 Tax=Burkholderia pyrrocinia TaxID=60550 RepID=UPI00201B62CE|nr:hypothetical protein [Burkholderia pyrrocinia]